MRRGRQNRRNKRIEEGKKGKRRGIENRKIRRGMLEYLDIGREVRIQR
jgi:hypothetical protein